MVSKLDLSEPSWHRALRLAFVFLALLIAQAPVRAAEPEIDDQTFEIDENSPNGASVGTVLASDPEQFPLTYAITGGNVEGAFAIGSSSGALTVANQAAFNYEVRPTFLLTVTVTDTEALAASAAITVTVLDVNEPPTVEDATLPAINEHSLQGTPVGQVEAEDPDPGDSLTYSITRGDPHQAFSLHETTGALTVNDSTALDYETTQTFVLTVRVTDDGDPAQFDEALITVPLLNVNEPPVADDAAFPLDENSPPGATVGQVVASDPEQAPNTLTYTFAGGNAGKPFAIDASSGLLTVDNSALLDYETNPVFNLTVRVIDGGELSDTAAITVNLRDVNDPPVAVDDNKQVQEDSKSKDNKIYVRANDSDQDGDNLLVVGVSEAQHGTPSVGSGNLYVLYAPDKDYVGADTFEYTITDNRGSPVTATVNIIVTEVNDAPVANHDWAQTLEDESVTIDVLVNDVDLEGRLDPSTVEVLSPPALGDAVENLATGQITYSPYPDQNGEDSFTYRVCDDGFYAPVLCSAPATVYMITEAEPDNPIADAGPLQTVFMGEEVTLDGSGSTDPDENYPLQYWWSYDDSPPITWLVPNTEHPTFIAPDEPAVLHIRLTVIDSEWDASLLPDEVVVTVENRDPHADAGPDQQVYTGEPVVLSGAGSYDEDGDQNLRYVWAQIGGSPTVALETDVTEPTATFTASVASTLIFRLYVYDSFGAHDAVLSQDDVVVVVNDPVLHTTYLPVVKRYDCAGDHCGPDLVVSSLRVMDNDIKVVISNQGSEPVQDWFWVDAYVQPSATPTIYDPWWDLGSTGIMWKVTSPLLPGDSLTLNRSNWHDIPLDNNDYSKVDWDQVRAGAQVYAVVDVHPNGGQVPEMNEQNNRLGPKSYQP